MSSPPQMNCLQNLARSSALPLQYFRSSGGHEPRFPLTLQMSANIVYYGDLDLRRRISVKAISSSKSSDKIGDSEVEEEKSDVYSTTMTEAMGAVLTYRHDLGMNYNFILPDLIVGSCLQNPEDVDKLRNIGVKTIFCLQQDPDLEYFGVDINTIREYAQSCGDIEHLRAEIRDFAGHDLRMRLPAVVSKLCKAIKQNSGINYIHCTAGLGRAPAVALAYMFWVKGYGLGEAHRLLQSKRPCCPKLDAIESATADILTGLKTRRVTLKWTDYRASMVEVSGLDIGWGQKMPLSFDKNTGAWSLERELPEGCYEYKYIVDGEWLCSKHDRITAANKDGNINNFVEVLADDPNSDAAKLRKRLTGEDPDLTTDERLRIKQYLEELESHDRSAMM